MKVSQVVTALTFSFVVDGHLAEQPGLLVRATQKPIVSGYGNPSLARRAPPSSGMKRKLSPAKSQDEQLKSGKQSRVDLNRPPESTADPQGRRSARRENLRRFFKTPSDSSGSTSSGRTSSGTSTDQRSTRSDRSRSTGTDRSSDGGTNSPHTSRGDADSSPSSRSRSSRSSRSFSPEYKAGIRAHGPADIRRETRQSREVTSVTQKLTSGHKNNQLLYYKAPTTAGVTAYGGSGDVYVEGRQVLLHSQARRDGTVRIETQGADRTVQAINSRGRSEMRFLSDDPKGKVRVNAEVEEDGYVTAEGLP